MGGGPMPPGSVKNYLIESILVTICCCVPFGIVGIVFASQVNSKLQQGDYQGAVQASENAKKWCMIGLILGLIANAIVAAIQIMAIAAQA
jgi:hypothetical protein